MPKLGDVFLNVVTDEKADKGVKTTDHPIEDGFAIVDHVEREPKTLSISGVIVGPDASTRLAKLEKYMNEGKRLDYIGRLKLTNVVIEKISTPVNSKIKNGFEFDISLKQVIVAKKQVVTQGKKPQPKTNKGQIQPVQKNKSKRTYVVQRGDTLWKIAQKVYGSKKGNLYTLIYNANKSVIGPDPDEIKPGMKLVIP